MSKLTVAALQLAFTEDTDANIRAVSELVREAASKGAQVVLPPELFEGPYFCRIEDEGLFATARPVAEHPSVKAMQKLADAATRFQAQLAAMRGQTEGPERSAIEQVLINVQEILEAANKLPPEEKKEKGKG